MVETKRRKLLPEQDRTFIGVWGGWWLGRS